MMEKLSKRDKAMMMIGAKWMLDKIEEVDRIDKDLVDDFIIDGLTEKTAPERGPE